MLDQAGNLIIADHGNPARYPYNWQVLCTLFLMPFREDFLVTFPMLISWAILGLSIYLLSVKIGRKRIYALAAASLVLTLPLVLNQVNTMHIDLPFGSFFIAALYFAFSYHKTRLSTDFLLFLASLGMLLGIKTPGLIYAFLLIAGFTIMELETIFLNKKNTFSFFQPSRLVVPVVTTGIFLLFFLGFFWYIKNFIDFGNPLGDVGVKVANITVFPGDLDYGEVKQSTLANRFYPTKLSHWKTLGIQFITRLQLPFIAMFVQVFLLPIALVIKQKPIKNETLIGLVALLISTVFLYCNTPVSGGDVGEPPGVLTPMVGYSIRYGFPFLSMLGVVAAASATVTRTRSELIVVIVLLSSILGITSNTIFDTITTASVKDHPVGGGGILEKLNSAPDLTISFSLNIIKTNFLDIVLYTVLYVLVILIINGVVFGSLNRNQLVGCLSRFFRQSGQLLIVSIFIGLIVTSTFVEREKRDIQRREIYGGIYEYIASNIGQDERIGYLLSRRSYLFYGKELNKEVLYTGSKSAQLSEWLADLRQRGVTVVAAGPLEPYKGKSNREVSWLENADGPFIRVFGQDIERGPVLYRLKGSLPRRSLQ
jgi:hypothetical protein